jgi:hypothetical protein
LVCDEAFSILLFCKYFSYIYVYFFLQLHCALK